MPSEKYLPTGRIDSSNTSSDISPGINGLLSRLLKVKQTGQGRYIACCPSHDDKNPSLAIRDDNGTILIKCFASCSAHDVVGAVGLSLSDLFPKNSNSSASVKNPFPAADVIRCIQTEALIVVIAACNLAKGITLSNNDLERLIVAASRLGACYE